LQTYGGVSGRGRDSPIPLQWTFRRTAKCGSAIR
jgi:hypothetical protein